MVRLAENKHYSEDKPIEELLVPLKVYLPLIQHLGKACNPLVEIGDSVILGQKIAGIETNVYAPIHASISGKVIAIQNWPHPVLGRAKAIVIESDARVNQPGFSLKSRQEIEKLTAQNLREIILNAGSLS